jgi:hypothetical protein
LRKVADMKRMGSYCKAYPLAAFRAFDGWHERVENARLEIVDGVSAPRVLDDTSIVFLQEDYSITDGVFLGEHVIFDAVTPAWIEFCRSRVDFAPAEAMQPRRDPGKPA